MRRLLLLIAVSLCLTPPATADEKPRMWAEMVGHWPAYDKYQKRTSRDIPVVVLERV